jgi:hypothetical protein
VQLDGSSGRIEHDSNRHPLRDGGLSSHGERRAQVGHRGVHRCGVAKSGEARERQTHEEAGESDDDQELEQSEGGAAHDIMEARR